MSPSHTAATDVGEESSVENPINGDDVINEFNNDNTINELNDTNEEAINDANTSDINNQIKINYPMNNDVAHSNTGSESTTKSNDYHIDEVNTSINTSLSSLLQPDTIEDTFNDELESFHQLTCDLSDTETLLSHLNDETVPEQRSVDDGANTDGE